MNSILRITHLALLAILLTSTAIDAKFTISTGKMRCQLPHGKITAGSDPREVLTKAWVAIETVKSFRFRIERLPARPDHTTVAEYVFPDRYHATQKNREAIIIGDVLYEKKGDERWRKTGHLNNSAGAGSVVLIAPKQKLSDFMKVAKDIKLIGTDTIDGVESLLYKYDLYDSSGNIMLMKMKVWVAVADGLVRKSEGQSQLELPRGTIIYTYYDYNADIKIEPPELLAELPVPETVQVNPQLQPERRGLESGNGTGIGPRRGNLNPDGSAKTVDSKPVLLNRPKPVYTDKARYNEVQGVVRLRALVGVDGLVKKVFVVAGLPDGLNEAAMQAAQKMKFRPAMKDGQPTAYWLNNILIEFRIKR